MKVAIYGRSFEDSFSEYVQVLFDTLNEFGWAITVYEPFSSYLYPRLSLSNNISTYNKHHEIKDDVDIMISIGGDGTFLETIHIVKNSGIPILGVNAGRLGFLASTQKEDIAEVLKDIKVGQYRLQTRSLLKLNSDINLFNDENFALNELTVHKKDSSSMITIHTYIDDLYLNSYWADGLIIATPTGSTAYSLSCGGPIIMPGSENIIISPIAPHNLNVRPIIINEKSSIRLKAEDRDQLALVSLDSRSRAFNSSLELIIKKADFKINLIEPKDNSFISTIRNKLMWGSDKRN